MFHTLVYESACGAQLLFCTHMSQSRRWIVTEALLVSIADELASQWSEAWSLIREHLVRSMKVLIGIKETLPLVMGVLLN